MAEDDEPQAKKAKVNEEETKMVKNSMKFNTLAQALKVDWSQTSYAKRVKRMDPSFFLLHVRRTMLYSCDELLCSDWCHLLDIVRVSISRRTTARQGHHGQ